MTGVPGMPLMGSLALKCRYQFQETRRAVHARSSQRHTAKALAAGMPDTWHKAVLDCIMIVFQVTEAQGRNERSSNVRARAI